VDPDGHMDAVPNGPGCFDNFCHSEAKRAADFIHFVNQQIKGNKTDFIIPSGFKGPYILGGRSYLKEQNDTEGDGTERDHTSYNARDFPDKWDLKANHPDYWSLTVTGGPPGSPVGVAVAFTRDRYGNYYVAPGGTAGKSAAAFSLSLTHGCVSSCSDSSFPDEYNTKQFLTGWSANGSGGFVNGAGFTWSPFAGEYVRHTSFEQGLYTPQFGVVVVFGIPLTP
jgi:hypothetical protein